jgi:hypothetical protein
MTASVRFTGINAALALKAPVRCATTGPITLQGLQTIDGVTFQQSDVAFPNSGVNTRVLVKDQLDKTTNGIYVVSITAWMRASDFDDNADCVQGTRVFVAQGLTNAGEWLLTTPDPIYITNSGNGLSLITFIVAKTDYISGFISSPADGPLPLVINIPQSCAIIETTTICQAGSCVATWSSGGVNLGATNNVSNVQDAKIQTVNNSVAVGGDITLTLQSVANCAGMSFTIAFTTLGNS